MTIMRYFLLTIMMSAMVACQMRKWTLLDVSVVVLTGSAAPKDRLADISADKLFGDVSPDTLLYSGKRQMYLLGKVFRKEFSSYLGSTNEKSQINFRTLNTLPGLMSSWALSLSLTPDFDKLETPYTTERAKPRFAGKTPQIATYDSPLPGRDSIKNISYSAFDDTDYLFQLSSLYACPNFNVRIVGREIKRISAKFRFEDSYKKVSDYIDFQESRLLNTSSRLYRASRLFEYVEAMHFAAVGNSFPADSQEYRDLEISHQAYITTIFADRDTLNLMNSPIFNLIKANIEDAKNRSTTGVKTSNKFSVYVAHKKFVLGILIFLGLYTPECSYRPYIDGSPPPADCLEFPKPGASIIFEFYREDFGTDIIPAFSNYWIRIRYNGKTVNVHDNGNRVSNENGYMEWNDFNALLKSKLVKNWEEECGLGGLIDSMSLRSTSKKWVGLLLVFNVLVFLLLGCVIICLKLFGKRINPDEKPEKDKLTNIPLQEPLN